MNHKWTFHALFLPFGLLICVLIFLVHFFFLEKPIHDYRLTFSVTSAQYENIVPKLIDFKYDVKKEDFFTSPNFESIADSLTEKNIRRFELKIFTPNNISPKKCAMLYFNQLAISPLPRMIQQRNFGSSIPLQKSLGFFVLSLCLFLILDYFLIKQRSRK